MPEFTCPHCGKQYKTRKNYEGKKIKCEECTETFVVSSDQPSTPPLADDTDDSLTNCPDCGNEVSKKAKECPNCGRPMEEKTKKKGPRGRGKRSRSGSRSSAGSRSRSKRSGSSSRSKSGITTNQIIIGILLCLVCLPIGIIYLVMKMD